MIIKYNAILEITFLLQYYVEIMTISKVSQGNIDFCKHTSLDSHIFAYICTTLGWAKKANSAREGRDIKLFITLVPNVL